MFFVRSLKKEKPKRGWYVVRKETRCIYDCIITDWNEQYFQYHENVDMYLEELRETLPEFEWKNVRVYPAISWRFRSGVSNFLYSDFGPPLIVFTIVLAVFGIFMFLNGGSHS